jgi:hypothetical protein
MRVVFRPSHSPGWTSVPLSATEARSAARSTKSPAIHHEHAFDRGRDKILIYTGKHLQQGGHLRSRPAHIIRGQRFTLRDGEASDFLDVVLLHHTQICQVPDELCFEIDKTLLPGCNFFHDVSLNRDNLSL